MYPTPKQILAAPPQKLTPEKLKSNIYMVKTWKKIAWEKNAPKKEQKKAIEILILSLCLINEVDFPLNIRWGRYDFLLNKRIHLSSPSIITALHETAHWIFNASELEACRFSVWIFKTVFPKAFTKLKWEGHMLKK